MRFKLTTYLLLLCVFVFAQNNSALLESLILNNPTIKKVLNNKSKYKAQIIYSQINRDINNKPYFVDHTYALDSSNYFYCASLVKLPCSIMALEKINKLNIPGLDKNSIFFTDSAFTCQTSCKKDTSSENGYPSIAHHIKKMLLVSDNYSYSRVFEFLNPKYIQKRMYELGYPNSRIVHRFDANCKGEANLHYNPVRFYDNNLNLLYSQSADTLGKAFNNPLGEIILGKDIYNRKKRLISEKKDFTRSNYMPLNDIHDILKRLVFQNHLNPNDKFNINYNDWEFLMKHLGMYPKESKYPKYNTKTYYDSFKKYFIYGASVPKIENDSIRIFNIVGRAYGFLIDCAYIVNFSSKTEFMLSSVIYTNERNSFGTGAYEYETVGLPYLKELSQEIYRYEQKRTKQNLPNLDEFNLFTPISKDNNPSLKKINVNGIITINNKPTQGLVTIRSINKNTYFNPELNSDKETGRFSINLLADMDYEIEFSVNNFPLQVKEISTKNLTTTDTLSLFIDFISPHLNQIIKTKQDSLFLSMVKAYNKISLKTFAEKYGDKKTEGLTYKVQIGAYKFFEKFNYASVAGMPIIIRETFDDYITRFTMGNYSTFNEANELLEKLKTRKLNDAFIIAVYKGKRMYLNELLEQEIVK